MRQEVTVRRSHTWLLLLSVLLCEAGATITGPGGCTTTCCMSCGLLGDTDCQVCYKLNPPSLNCPCLDSLNKEQLDRLIQLRDARTEARIEIKTEPRIEARTEARTEMDREGLSCLPICCPSLRCTRSSCPQCYRRHRENRQKCPCRKW